MMNLKKRKRAMSAIAIALALMCMAQEMLCTVPAQAAELPTEERVRELSEVLDKAREQSERGMVEYGGDVSEKPDMGAESFRYAAKSPQINKSTLNLVVGQTATLKITGTTKKITWTSDNKKVATVNDKGVVKAKSKGDAVISGRIKGDKELLCIVYVRKETSSSAKTKLKNYILKHGTKISDGSRAIAWDDNRYEDYNIAIIIEYTPSKNLFSFYSSCYDSDYDEFDKVEMLIPFKNTTKKIPVSYKKIDSYGTTECIAESKINMSTYNFGDGAKFKIVETSEYCDNDIKKLYAKLANTVLEIGMLEWDELLEKRIGIGMKDIGFQAF